MPVFGALRTPLRVGASGYVLNLVERVLNIGFERWTRVDMLLRQGVAGIDGEHGLHFQILAPLKKFEQAHAIGGAVAPGAGMCWPICPVAERLLPVKPLGDMLAFKI